MTAFTPGDPRAVELAPGLVFAPGPGWRGNATAAPGGAVLGASPAADPAAGLELFEPEGPPIALDVTIAPPAVLGEEPQPGDLVYTPAEPEAVYALLQAIETPDGTVYDFTLPRPVQGGGVLGGGAAAALRFPVNPLIGPPPPAPATLGFESVVGGFIGDLIARRVLRIVRAPLDRALRQAVAQAEGAPQVLALRRESGAFQPLESVEAWRALIPSGGERRVLLFIHGFASSTARSSGAAFLPALAAGYDAVLAYDHPTLATSPLDNALALLERVPEDLHLSVDLVAHSRGGLVARSLVELIEPLERFAPRRLVTFGSPHAGTELANRARWDRLVSVLMTGASWLAAVAGCAVPIPKVIEWVLKAAAQSMFDLPGVAAMAPPDGPDGNPFLAALNAAAPPGALQERVRYAAVASAFSLFGPRRVPIAEALTAMAAQAFIGQPNDLVVPTQSMSAIDAAGTVPADRVLRAAVPHFGYFADETVLAFVRQQLIA